MILLVRARIRGHATRLDLGRDLLQALLARLFLPQHVSGTQIGFRRGGHARHQRLVFRGRLPFPKRLPGLLDQLMNQFDYRLLLLMTEDDRAQHHFFR